MRDDLPNHPETVLTFEQFADFRRSRGQPLTEHQARVLRSVDWSGLEPSVVAWSLVLSAVLGAEYSYLDRAGAQAKALGGFGGEWGDLGEA